jgi:5-methylcytosine-specific restriction endonuclease McrA
MLYEECGKIPIEYERIAFELRTEIDVIKSVINNFGLFVIEDDYFYSETVIERFRDRINKSEKARTSVSKKWGNTLLEQNRQNRSERLSAARKLGSHSKEEWEGMKLFFNNKCVKCNKDGVVVKDHIIPLYQGGSDSITNLQPLCQSCNTSKGSDDTDYRRHYCELNAYEMPTEYIITPTIKERKGKDSKGEKESVFLLPEWIKQETWGAFMDVRRKLKAPQTDHALSLIISKLDKLRMLGQNTEEILNESITNGWKGIFPLKSGGNGNRHKDDAYRGGSQPIYRNPGQRQPAELSAEAQDAIAEVKRIERETAIKKAALSASNKNAQ